MSGTKLRISNEKRGNIADKFQSNPTFEEAHRIYNKESLFSFVQNNHSWKYTLGQVI